MNITIVVQINLDNKDTMLLIYTDNICIKQQNNN